MTFVPPPTPAVPPITPPASLTEFSYVPQASTNPVGVTLRTMVNGAAVLINADNNEMVVSVYAVPYPVTAVGAANSGSLYTASTTAGTVTNPSTGTYQIFMPSSIVPGHYRLDWAFSLNGSPVVTSVFVEVGSPSPAYDALNSSFANMVENVWIKFADIYDSPFGGPHLTVWYNTHFGRGRIAQFMEQACQHLNNEAQPVTNYSTTGVSPSGSGAPLFPLNLFAGLLNTATTIEVVKHLKRSYTEEPQMTGSSSARLDRSM